MRFLPCLALLLATLSSRAAPPPAPAQPPPVSDTDQALETPRATYHAFLEAARHGHWTDAAQELSPDGPGATGPAFANLPNTARELKAVLDTYLFDVGPEDVSDRPEGKADPKLPANLDELGRVPSTTGRGTDSVRLQRMSDGRWLFATSTVAHVPGWYQNLPDRWIRDHLPEPLLRPGPRDVFWWQYIALFAVAIVSFLLGSFLQVGLRWLMKRIAKRTGTVLDSRLLRGLRGPLALFLATVVAHLLLPSLLLTKPAEEFLSSVLVATRLLALYWSLIRAVELAADTARQSHFLTDRPETAALLPLASRAAKVTLSIIAVIVFLQKLGYPAASLIAGLGIGGLAFALAAQKTVENLFGSVMLSIDQPFRPGDTVKVEDLVGTVETVGLRSTRIRTGERTMVTIPNGRLADMRIESYAPRDRLRFGTSVGLVYDTTAAQLRAIIADIKLLLETHPKRYPDPVRVVLQQFGESSLDLDVSAWFATTDGTEFQQIRQELLLAIMEVVEKNGSSLAFPTRTLRVVSEGNGTATRG